MEGLANQVAEGLSNTVGDALIGVGYYSSEHSDIVYLREDMETAYTSGRVLEELLDTALLESIATPMYERLLEQDLVATTRIYDGIIDTVLIVEANAGIVFGLERGSGEYSEALAVAEETIQDAGLPVEQLVEA